MNDITIKIGERIQARRKELNLTQEMIANKLSLNKSTIARYESGVVEKIKLPVIQAMAQILDVNPDWLALKTDKKGCYADCVDITKNIQLSKHEAYLILAYREHPDMQKSVDKLLGIEPEEKLYIIKKAARNGDNSPLVVTDSKLKELENLPEVPLEDG
nr:MAG TPA: hypothetical protein [Myoviridae sp. ctLGX4]